MTGKTISGRYPSTLPWPSCSKSAACRCRFQQVYAIGLMHRKMGRRIGEHEFSSPFCSQNDTSLPLQCRECEVIAACRGGCPKHRFGQTLADESGLHYLCRGYRHFFCHIRKYLRMMTQLLENGLPVSLVMDAVKGPLVVKKQ